MYLRTKVIVGHSKKVNQNTNFVKHLLIVNNFIITAIMKFDKTRFHLISMMDDLKILYQRRHQADNDTDLGLAKNPPMLKLA